MYTIAADTVFFGDPVETYLDDRQLFNDAFVRYYLDFEAEYTLVACIDGFVLGYLTRCKDTVAQQKRLSRKT